MSPRHYGRGSAMTKVLELAQRLKVEELYQLYRLCEDNVKKSHLQVIWLLASGRTRTEVSEVTGLCSRWIREIINRYNKDGPDGLGDLRQQNQGGKPLLSGEFEQEFRSSLAGPPPGGGFWTGPKAAVWIARRLGIEKVHPQRGWDYLKRCGYSLQMPRPRHAKAATPEQQNEFKKNFGVLYQNYEAFILG
jgi:transposase